MMPVIKAEKVNGRIVGRPHAIGGDGIMTKLPSSSVFFPPTVTVVYPLETLVEQEARAIVGLRAMTSNEIAKRLWDFAQRAIQNEKGKPANG